MSYTTDVAQNRLYRNDALIRSLAKSYQTPLYVFDEQSIRDRCREIKSAVTYQNFRPRYAFKALSLSAILNIIRDEGFWADASSINEVYRAVRNGFSCETIYYTGEGASAKIYGELVERDVLINCTSLDQLELLGTVGGTECSLRINVGKGHGESHKTDTGGPNSKHGIYFDQILQAREIAKHNGIRIIGIHSHVGSGGSDLAKWLEISDMVLDIAREFPDIEVVNLGGGMPVIYNAAHDQAMPIREWGKALSERMEMFSEAYGRDVQLQIEPGRYLVAGSGLLVAEAQAIKRTSDTNGVKGKKYVIVDSGHNHNIRPALYHSRHPIRFIARDGGVRDTALPYVVAGNLCESGDLFTVDSKGLPEEWQFSEILVGDLMVMAGAGAYTHSMKSEYNSMNTPAAILISSGDVPKLIERRGTLDDIMAREVG